MTAVESTNPYVWPGQEVPTQSYSFQGGGLGYYDPTTGEWTTTSKTQTPWSYKVPSNLEGMLRTKSIPYEPLPGSEVRQETGYGYANAYEYMLKQAAPPKPVKAVLPEENYEPLNKGFRVTPSGQGGGMAVVQRTAPTEAVPAPSQPTTLSPIAKSLSLVTPYDVMNAANAGIHPDS